MAYLVPCWRRALDATATPGNNSRPAKRRKATAARDRLLPGADAAVRRRGAPARGGAPSGGPAADRRPVALDPTAVHTRLDGRDLVRDELVLAEPAPQRPSRDLPDRVPDRHASRPSRPRSRRRPPANGVRPGGRRTAGSEATGCRQAVSLPRRDHDTCASADRAAISGKEPGSPRDIVSRTVVASTSALSAFMSSTCRAKHCVQSSRELADGWAEPYPLPRRPASILKGTPAIVAPPTAPGQAVARRPRTHRAARGLFRGAGRGRSTPSVPWQPLRIRVSSPATQPCVLPRRSAGDGPVVRRQRRVKPVG